MPTYEYRCNSCGHEFEVFQSMSDEPVKKCPECACDVERLIGGGGGLIFKGSGFYSTDYRSESYKKSAKADKADKPVKTEKSKKKSSAKVKNVSA